MTSQDKAMLTRKATTLYFAWCNKYTGTRPEKYCRGCKLARSVYNRDYAAMREALKTAAKA